MYSNVTITQSISESAGCYALLQREDAKHLCKKSDPADQTILVTDLFKMTHSPEESINLFGTRFLHHYELFLYHKPHNGMWRLLVHCLL